MLKRLAISLVAASLFSVGVSGTLLAQDAEQETVQEPVVLGGRVEVPSAGYALTVPEDWVAFYPSTDDAAAITEALRGIDPELAVTLEAALADGVGFSFLAFGLADETGFRDNCNVIDYPAEGASLDMAVATDMAAMGDMGEALVGEPVTESIDLPAGDSVRIDYALEYPGVQAAFSAYYYTDGTKFHLLTCTGTERPDDSWRSIAETFEFLTAGDVQTPAAETTPAP